MKRIAETKLPTPLPIRNRPTRVRNENEYIRIPLPSFLNITALRFLFITALLIIAAYFLGMLTVKFQSHISNKAKTALIHVS